MHRRQGGPRWWVLALVAALVVGVAAAAAAGAAQLLDPRHGARVELIADVGDIDAQPRADRLLATQVVVIASRAVLGPVAESRGVSPRALARQVDVELLADSQVLEVTVSSTDPASALALTEDITAAYLDLADEVDAIGAAGTSVLTPPFVLEEPLGPGTGQALAAGTLAGILLAAVTVYGLRRLGREDA